MPIYKIKLISKKEVTDSTLLFKFEKPEGLSFIPGQYGGFTLINPSEIDPGGITRRFSLLSTPQDDFLAIATRRQNSAFKRALENLAPGDEIKFAGPTGNFTLHEDLSVPAVMIAGGIGIAPFWSILQHAKQTNRIQTLYLFYGNQTTASAAFLAELQTLAEHYPHFKFIPTLAEPDVNWTGESGFIDYKLLRKYIQDLNMPIYYVCGSPTMVTTLQETLVELGIAEDHIRVEDFPGYK